jgi:hypothetical protein
MNHRSRNRLLIAGAVLALFGFVAVAALFAAYPVAREPTDLMQAARRGDSAEVQRLLAAGADVNERRGHSFRFGFFFHGPPYALYGESPLLFAIESTDLATVRALLDAGADTAAKDSTGRGVWDYSLRNLHGSGANVFLLLVDVAEFPASHVGELAVQASYAVDPRVREFALSQSASDESRKGALCAAATMADLEMMQRWLATFASPPADGLLCAIGAPREARRAAIDLMLARGVDPNGVPGMHPLSAVLLTMVAGAAADSVPEEQRELFEVLLEHGSDPTIVLIGPTVRANSNAIDFARGRGDEAAAVFLETWRREPVAR